MRANYQPCIIFSVDKAGQDKYETYTGRTWAKTVMRNLGIKFEEVLGVYQGQEEMSFIVTDMQYLSVILGLAKEFDQDSVLLRDNENFCHLKFFDGRDMMPLGYLKEVTEKEAKASDAYTYSPSLNAYFRCIV